MENINTYIEIATILVAIVSNWALFKYRLGKLEDNFEKEMAAVKIAKNSKIKEIKEDYKERIQVLHERIDRTRDENNKRFDDVRKESISRNNQLEKKIDNGFSALNSRLDNFLNKD